MYSGIWKYKYIRKIIKPVSYYSSIINVLDVDKNDIFYSKNLILKINNYPHIFKFAYINRETLVSDLKISCQRTISMQDVIIAYTSIGFAISKFILKFRSYLFNNYRENVNISLSIYEEEMVRGTVIGLQEGLNQDENIPSIEIINFKYTHS